MKKEIKALLNSENATLEINHILQLKRWTKDAIGTNVDRLVLETKTINGSTRYHKSIEITSRTTAEIMDEVNAGITKIMMDIADDMSKRWRGGLI